MSGGDRGRAPSARRVRRPGFPAGRIRRLAAGGMVLLAAAAAGCRGPEPSGPRGLVLVVIDTLRGDRPGYAGYAPASTPTLDSLAAAGTVFTEAMTPVPVTLPAVASLLTARLPLHHGVRDNDRFVLDATETTLAERFRDRGFRTGAVVASAVLAADRGVDQGFELYDDDFRGPYPVYDPVQRSLAGDFAATRRRADRVTDLALERLRGFGDEPFFLLVHYFDVHMQLDPPPRWRDLHPGRPYDGETSFVDYELGRLLAALRERDDVLVVVTADHGESQGEHGEPQHGFLLYEATLHVPLVAAGPGVPAGAVREDPVSLVDLGATIFSIFELAPSGVELDGRTLAWERPETEPVPLYAETFRPLVSYGWRELRAMRLGSMKLITGPPDELYDLDADPHELRDLDGVPPAAELRAALDAVAAGDDPEAVLAASRDTPDPARRELLESLGYVAGDGGPEPAAGPRPHPRDELPRWVVRQWVKEELRRIILLIEDGDAAAAEARLDSVVAVSPQTADAWYLRGLARDDRGDSARAERDFRRALERDRTHLLALAVLARHAERRGDDDDALDLWERLFAADESDREAVLHLANLHIAERNPEAALPFLRRLAAIRPEDPAVSYNLGVAAELTGREAEAVESYETYLELAPDGDQAAAAREYLREHGSEAAAEESHQGP